MVILCLSLFSPFCVRAETKESENLSLALQNIYMEEDTVKVKMRNTAAAADQVTMKAYIYKQVNQEQVGETAGEEMEITGDSTFEIQIPLKGEILGAGDYTLHVELVTQKETWIWEKDFSIEEKGESGESSDVLMENETPKEKTKTDSAVGKTVFIILAVPVMAAALVICLVLIRKNRKKKEDLLKSIKDSIKDM